VAYTLIVRTLSQTITTESLLFWNLFPVGVVGTLLSFDVLPSIKLGTLAILIGAGLLNIMTNGLYNKAARLTTPTNVAQTHYTQIIFGALIGYLLWNEMPTWNLLAGTVLIVVAGLVAARQAQRDDKAAPVSN
jgi:drug/metabolite transporter (DMT)-like permease